MFSSLRARLWLSYALLIVTALGIVAMILFISLLRNPLLYRQTLERLRAVQTLLVERDEQPPFAIAARKASRMFNVRILQYSQDGQILFDTSSGKASALPFPGSRILSRKISIARDDSGGAWLYSLETLSDDTYLLVAVPRPRVSIVSVFTDDFLPLIIQSGLIALVLSLFLAFIFARWIADPLQRVVFAARGVPSMEARPVYIQGPQEVQELTRAFNSMVARVQSSQQSQREFVANVSHELKTPLTAIQGFAQAILDDTADSPEKRKQAAEVIYAESARMHRMVLDLLDLARLDAGIADITMSPVNLSALMNAIVEKFTPQSQKAGVEIKMDIPVNLPFLSADGDRLSQVFTNLVDNALKFTPRDGQIRIIVSALNGQLLVSITDSGVGISPEVQKHIFDRFYQADPARKGGKRHGAGLGLAIAREIVHAHGGRISVRSRLGEGTTFEVVLPVARK
jgi:two-component system, OmpR family, sensor kinase